MKKMMKKLHDNYNMFLVRNDEKIATLGSGGVAGMFLAVGFDNMVNGNIGFAAVSIAFAAWPAALTVSYAKKWHELKKEIRE